MRTFLIGTALFLAGGFTMGQNAGALKSSYEIVSGGTVRQMTLVADEIAVREADGKRTVSKAGAADLAAAAKATRVRSGGVAKVELMLTHTTGGARAKTTRHFVTQEVLVKLKAGTTAKEVAQRAGVRVSSEPGHAPGYAVMDALTSEGALVAMEALRAQPEVESANVVLATQKEAKFTPNDPLFSEQWHLRNSSQLGGALWTDTNITSVWDAYKGTGITIGIIDGGLEYTHPDLAPNYNTDLDFDYNGNDADPAPADVTTEKHATACAGVAAARGNNGLGGTGAAPEATLTGFRLIAAANTDQDEANAFLTHNDVIQVKSNSWGWPDGDGYGGPDVLATAALQTGASSGRGGKGTIYVFAGGNGLIYGDNSNYDGYASSPYVIAVGAVNDFGFQSYYSEPGANLMVSAPSNGGMHNAGIRTTDITGEGGYNTTAAGTNDLADRNYTKTFGGTSSACPLVSGIVSLMLQANPNLGWRDVQEILIRTARKNHRTDTDWVTNQAGLSFNHKYGAGIIDAAAAVALAQQWTNLPAMTTQQMAVTGLNVALTDNSTTGGSTQSFNFTAANFRVEHVTVAVGATHTCRGDLEITLTSPSGMVSKLAQVNDDTTANLAWTFGTVRHWGETGAGTWTVTVNDRVATQTGALNSVTVTLLGATNANARIVGTGATLTAEGNTPANSAADPGEAVTFNVGLKNIGAAATSNLTATLMATGGVSNPSAAQNYGALSSGGAAVTRSFSFTPSGGCGMSVPLLLKLQDGATNLGYVSVNVPLGTSATANFAASGTIIIRDTNPALPSPSPVTVSGLVGRVQTVTAAFTSFTHSYVNDVGALLHGPDALEMRLFNGGIRNRATALDLTFSDNADVPFPYLGTSMTAGAYKPYYLYSTTSRPFTGDVATEMGYTLGEFSGLQGNGTWNLYVQDYSAGDTGTLGGWSLNFTTVTCTDNVMLTQSASSGAEGAGSILVSVTRTGGKEGSATVNYATSNGTATAGSDYTATSGTLSFAVGELVKTFAIPITNDTALESNETIQVTLSSAGGNTTLGTLASGSVTIVDDDAPTPVAISPATQTVTEAATQVTFTVSRSTAGNAGTVNYATAYGNATAADFTATSGTLSFAAGDLSKTFTVTLLDDAVIEAAESFTVTISGPTGGLTLGTPVVSTITIVDGDADADGMTDDYEQSVGLNAAVNDATLDLDGDGISNYKEFILGTAPNSGSSQYPVTAASAGGNISITFPTLTGRTYKVERSDNASTPWTTVQQGIAGTGSNQTATDTGGAAQPRRFYRVTVTLP
ncbi:S8 family serine peptidase [Prosthecobacter sp.]|uniref:S8 family serine peptidase n=1 Tax=Prosthecobacter sp. TaxID=1965333 RepID=UPI0037844913